MTTAQPTPDQRIGLPQTDQRMYLSSTWEKFRSIQAALGGQEGIRQEGFRLGYVDGQIEIVQKGHRHTFLETVIGLLVTKFLLARQVAFVSSAMTWQERESLAIAQADWAFSFGNVKQAKPIPDLSIEIVPETGWALVHKYEVLGTPEVWFWWDDKLAIYHRRDLNYEQIDRSELEGLQDLDTALLERCVLQAEEDFVSGVSLFESYCIGSFKVPPDLAGEGVHTMIKELRTIRYIPKPGEHQLSINLARTDAATVFQFAAHIGVKPEVVQILTLSGKEIEIHALLVCEQVDECPFEGEISDQLEEWCDRIDSNAVRHVYGRRPTA